MAIVACRHTLTRKDLTCLQRCSVCNDPKISTNTATASDNKSERRHQAELKQREERVRRHEAELQRKLDEIERLQSRLGDIATPFKPQAQGAV